MKLDIQMFSGGSYDYLYHSIDEYYVGKMYDLELDDMIKDLVDLLHDLEWWQSGDYEEEDYRKEVKKFKSKWFIQDRNERLKKYIDDSLKKQQEQLYNLVGDTNVKGSDE